MDAWKCPECGAYVAWMMKGTHEDEHNALIECLETLRANQLMLLTSIRGLETRIQALEGANLDPT